MILDPTEHELLILSEHDELIAKKFFTPKLFTVEEENRLLELEKVIVPNIYKKVALNI
jgi:hypothetical protein